MHVYLDNMDKKELFKEICLDWKWFQEYTIISDKCYVCHKKIDRKNFDVKVSYWRALWVPTHKDCSMKQDIVSCHKIDADCNDCKHFLREKMETRGIFSGKCKKFNKEVKAYPNFCSNRSCFEHR